MDLEDVKPKGAKRAKRITSTNKVALGATGVVSLFGIGSTLASNITLNGGGNVEFGQGVAHQVACSKNGFSITPLEQFDNRLNVHRVTALRISGIEMTPIGTNYLNSGEGFAEDASGLAAAKVAHPGQYFNTSTHEWTPTCDNVVLDFQMYTNNPQYLKYTYSGYESNEDGFSNITPSGINSPLLWHTQLRNDATVSQGADTDAAIALHWKGTYYENNYGKLTRTRYDSGPSGWVWSQGDPRNDPIFPPGSDFSTPSSASFDIYIDPANFYGRNNSSVQSDNYAPVAAAVSSITVETMNYFPTGTPYIFNSNPGAPGIRP